MKKKIIENFLKLTLIDILTSKRKLKQKKKRDHRKICNNLDNFNQSSYFKTDIKKNNKKKYNKKKLLKIHYHILFTIPNTFHWYLKYFKLIDI